MASTESSPTRSSHSILHEIVTRKKPWWEMLTSGRWWLTIMCGAGFLYSIIMEITLSTPVVAILMLVFNSYFLRPDRDDSKNSSDVKKE